VSDKTSTRESFEDTPINFVGHQRTVVDVPKTLKMIRIKVYNKNKSSKIFRVPTVSFAKILGPTLNMEIYFDLGCVKK